MSYLLDANVLISASRLNYSFDLCPGFWDWLKIANQQGVVFSIDAVFSELQPVEGNLADWSRQMDEDFFKSIDSQTLQCLGIIEQWVRNKHYQPTAVETFLQVADSRLIAYALAHGHTVVTHERSAPRSIKSVKIPDVCNGTSVKCIDPFQMLKHEKAKFILQ